MSISAEQQLHNNSRVHYESRDEEPELDTTSPPRYAYLQDRYNNAPSDLVPQTPPPSYTDTFTQRRSSIIRTSFI